MTSSPTHFEICVAAGMQASNLGVPILAEELQRREFARDTARQKRLACGPESTTFAAED